MHDSEVPNALIHFGHDFFKKMQLTAQTLSKFYDTSRSLTNDNHILVNAPCTYQDRLRSGNDLTWSRTVWMATDNCTIVLVNN